jgi:hypothetical protein
MLLEFRILALGWLCIFGVLGHSDANASPAASTLMLKGNEGAGDGQKIVLVSGDEEYRSEEALPQLAKILSGGHGFHCTVLFAIDPETGIIAPNHRHNIPGLDSLRDAQLMIIATRFRDLPDSQMKEIDDYLKRGGPVVGLRTATHGFNIPAGKKYSHYGNGYDGKHVFWKGGFGRAILGEKWISHHGNHRKESTRGVPAPGAENHPILYRIGEGDIWGPTDVYGVRLPLPGDSRPIVLGQVLAGMQPDDEPVAGTKNNPMLPIAWTKTYRVPGGQSGRVFTTTMGSSTDLLSEGTRRMLINGIYWAMGLEDDLERQSGQVDLVEPYEATDYGFKSDDYWSDKALKPADFLLP